MNRVLACTAVALLGFGCGGAGAAPAPADQKPTEYVLEARADEAGKLAKITLRDEADPKKVIDVGADLAALEKKLKGFVAKRKDKPGKLTIAIDGKMIQSHVVQLFDVSVQAGFTDISPVLLDPKKR